MGLNFREVTSFSPFSSIKIKIKLHIGKKKKKKRAPDSTFALKGLVMQIWRGFPGKYSFLLYG